MNERKIPVVLCLAALITGCRSGPIQQPRPDVSVTLHPITRSPLISSVTNSWLITAASQRDPIPAGAMAGPRGVFFPDGLTPELEKWKEKYTVQVDLIVEIRNISTHELRFFEEWNSWGHDNLKFVFENGSHKYRVTKQPGLWYRNFPSVHTLKPGECFQIPVAFADHIWSGLDQIRANAHRITSVRALYEQHHTPTTEGPQGVWEGMISSQSYPAAELIPRLRFRKAMKHRDQEAEIRPVQPMPVDVRGADDIKVDVAL